MVVKIKGVRCGIGKVKRKQQQQQHIKTFRRHAWLNSLGITWFGCLRATATAADAAAAADDVTVRRLPGEDRPVARHRLERIDPRQQPRRRQLRQLAARQGLPARPHRHLRRRAGEYRRRKCLAAHIKVNVCSRVLYGHSFIVLTCLLSSRRYRK